MMEGKLPVRIYSLAKELNYDSKKLVDVCKQAGITGKGSALASLSEDEIQQVKNFLNKGSETEAPAETAAAPTKPAPTKRGPIKVVSTPRPSSSPPKRRSKAASEGDETSEDDVSPADTSPADVSPADVSPADTSLDDNPAADTTTDQPISPADTPIQRRSSLTPRRRTGIKVLGKSQSPSTEDNSSKPVRKSADRSRAPIVKLASMPDAPAAPKKARDEGKTLKPEMSLSDALKSKVTKRGPLQHLTKGGEEGPKESPDNAGRKDVRNAKGVATKEDGGLAGMATARANRKSQQQRQESATAIDRYRNNQRRGRRRTLKRTGKNTAAPRKSKVALELPCTIRSFSEAAGVSASDVQTTLMDMGHMVTINAMIDEQVVQLLALDLGVDLEFKEPETLEDVLITQLDAVEDNDDSLVTRPPIITFLGHVDHGKTSLLDHLIDIDVVSGEAGGITQHIRAYQIENDGEVISFVDTPGHEAFTEMRARGANVTDIAVIVVAADDGIMPQTEEAISHAKAAEVPIIVALNKIDLPGMTEERLNTVLGQLPAHDLTPSEWGGDVEVVRTSAITGEGMDNLRSTILGIAELHEYTANPSRAATGVCLEAHQETGRGIIAKLIVKNGTLRVGDVVVCGVSHGKIKAMYNPLNGELITEAGPSTPVNITGLDLTPGAGDTFHVLESITDAREIADRREEHSRASSLSGNTIRISFEDFQTQLEDGRLGINEVTTINLIIRTDVRGSIEAIRKELGKLVHDEVQIKILQASVGGITAADVVLADASQAVIVGFNVAPENDARILADEKNVEIRRYDIIYKITDDLRLMLEGQLKPEERVVEVGHALVQQVFSISRLGTIAGCRVIRGTIERDNRIRVIRDGRVIGDYALDSLKREKDDAKSVRDGMECGIKLVGYNDIKQDDVLEAYKIEEFARTL
jgi:translation initiation factor IF-2